MDNKDFWKSEAEGVIRDIQRFVKSVSVSTKCSSSNTGIFFNITTLEETDLCVELVAGGFGVVGNGYDKVEKYIDEARLYETPYALLNEKSPGFKVRFAELLASKIKTLKENQDGRENNSD
ncbi:hypothetical protein CHUAL_000353 [Chamberlinius hualienensis]